MFRTNCKIGCTLFITSFLATAVSAQAASTSTTAPATPQTEIKVLSNRTEAHMAPLFQAFEKKSGIKVSASFIEKGLLERLESRPSEADVIVSAESELLAIAKQKKLLQPYKSQEIATNVPAEFRDNDNNYLVDAYRARVILYSKDRVKTAELSTYEDLATPKWKGKICIRSGFHEYNVALFSQFMVEFGKDKAKKIIEGLHNNLAREPKGNDREQAKGIFEGKCNVALLNSYYYPMMITTPEQKAWAEATKVFFPDQQGKGSLVMRSGAAITKESKKVKAATALLEFLVSKEGQELMTKTTFQYPVNKSVAFHESARTMGEGQPGIKDGKFKVNFIPLKDVAKDREEVMAFLNQIGFDKMP